MDVLGKRQRYLDKSTDYTGVVGTKLLCSIVDALDPQLRENNKYTVFDWLTTIEMQVTYSKLREWIIVHILLLIHINFLPQVKFIDIPVPMT